MRSTIDSPEISTRKTWLQLMILLIALILVGGPACEDEVVQGQPKGGAEGGAKGGGGKKGGGKKGGGKKGGGKKGKKGGATPIHTKGSFELETDIALPIEVEAEVPEPNAEAIWGSVEVANPYQVAQFVGLLAGTGASVSHGDISLVVSNLYGLPRTLPVDWTQPSLLLFTESVETPLMAVPLTDKERFLSSLPKDAISQRQGNAFTIKLDVTRSLYVNLTATHAVFSSDWRQYPLVHEELAKLLAARPKEETGLLSGTFDLQRAPNVWRHLTGLAAPGNAVNIGWEDGLSGVEFTVDSAAKAHLDLHSVIEESELRYEFTLRLESKEHGPLRTMVAETTPADPAALLGLLTYSEIRQVLWHDFRHDPLIWEGLAGISVTARLGEEIDARQTRAELRRAQVLKGPAVWVQGGDQTPWTVGIAEVGDRAKLDGTLAELNKIVPRHLEKRQIDTKTEDEPVASYKRKDGTGVALEVIRGDNLMGLQTADEDTVRTLLAPADVAFALPPWLADATGKPLMLYVARFGAFDARPLALGLFIEDNSLYLRGSLPKAQLKSIDWSPEDEAPAPTE